MKVDGSLEDREGRGEDGAVRNVVRRSERRRRKRRAVRKQCDSEV